MVSNGKFDNYEVVDLFKYYNFDINFVFIYLDIEKVNSIMLHLFLETCQIPSRLWKCFIFRGGWKA